MSEERRRGNSRLVYDKAKRTIVAEPNNPVVGYKTFRDEDGYYHEPLRQDEAQALLAACDAAKAKREADMPDERAALRVLGQAYQRLQELGWDDAIYCPKDGTHFQAIEAGSTGVHDCNYQGEWPKGTWWVFDGDVWPSRPILFRLYCSGDAAKLRNET